MVSKGGGGTRYSARSTRTREQATLLVRRLRAWRDRLAARRRRGGAVTEREDRIVACRLQRLANDELVQSFRLESGDILQEIGRLDSRCPHLEVGVDALVAVKHDTGSVDAGHASSGHDLDA